jgi:hypothetical protein
MTHHGNGEHPTEDDANTTDDTADAPTGGDESTEDRLEADNPAEEEVLKTLDPDAAHA